VIATRDKRSLLLAAVLVSLALLTVAGSAEASIYWANSGSTIGRANTDGSNATQTFITGANSPCGVAVNASNLFWTNDSDGTFGRSGLDGGGVTENLFGGADNPCGIAVDAAHIYWTNNVAAGSLGRANLDGSAPEQNLIGPMNHPCGVAVDANYIYWANRDGLTIGRANLDGSSPVQNFITLSNQPCGIAVDAAHVYWTYLDGTTVGRANLDGGSLNESFITGASHPTGVAVDANYIYWANTSASSIGRANLDGSGVNQSLVTGANVPLFVAVDVPPAAPAPPLIVPALAITELRVSPSPFPAARNGGSIARKRRRSTGTTVSYKDSQAATAKLTVLRARTGVRRNGKCVAARKKHRRKAKHSARRCVRYVTVGSFTHADVAGANTFHFRGRVAGHSLAPGGYRLVAVPILGTQTGTGDRRGFGIKP
jgi:sugar lactone lactonase YvrE